MRLEDLHRVTFTTPESWSVTRPGAGDRYIWLNDRVCAIGGEVRSRVDGNGFDVVLAVTPITWEPLRGRDEHAESERGS